LLDDTRITCIYKRDNVRYGLEWSTCDQKVSIKRWDDEKEWVSEEGDAYSRFPVKIFSQKQIFDLAKYPNNLLRLIDESSSIHYQKWLMDWNEKRSKFLTLCNKRRELEAILQKKSIFLGQLSDVEQKIKTIENSGHKEVLSNYQSFQLKSGSIDLYKSSVVGFFEKVSNLIISHNFNFDKTIFNDNVDAENEVVERISNFEKALNDFNALILERALLLSTNMSDFSNWLLKSDFQNLKISSEKNYEDLVGRFLAQGINQQSDYSSLLKERESIIFSLKNMEEVEENLKTTMNDQARVYTDIIFSRKSLTLSRQEFINKNLAGNSSIKVEISPLCDSDGLEKSFRDVLGKSDGTFLSEICDSDKRTGFLFNLDVDLNSTHGAKIENIISLDYYFSILDDFKVDLFDFRKGEVYRQKIGKRFIDFMMQQKAHIFDAINLWFPEDKLTIKFHDGKKFRDFSQGSAGQKASAVLYFLLSYGAEPLILDQPEDDLDNGLITNLIVSKLHDNKANRQIIIVTHNPNIVVNGDSEYVISLEDKGQIKVLSAGSLQETSVRKNVCEIMEGGELALQKRYNRMFINK
jgi:hypothetical protein